ncbi:caspase-9 [Phascolarctos cinereus]|uniref:Caspase-9 n=1 Tax=Phascolarctos cinereus TaxID=38626 RepID=A0A6P5J6I5_PHACI|nr:caspase-9 [Phascolarctos cinereus]
MEEAQRELLQQNRLRLVRELRVEPLWDLMLAQELFTRDMIEDIQAGTRRDQARQLITDLQTRGKRALPIFISCLEDTGQWALATLLRESNSTQQLDPIDIKPIEMVRSGESSSTCMKLPTRSLVPGSHTSKEEDPEASYLDVAQGAAGPVQARCWRNFGVVGQVYTLNSDPCGYCLIINNVDFHASSGLSVRTGSNIDCEKMQKRFQALYFAVEVKCNLSAQAMGAALQQLAKRDHSALDCCVVVILSHGCQASHIQFPGAIYGVDGASISVETIVNIFSGSRCPSLGGKPKLFFIQACGGDQRDHGFQVSSNTPEDESPGSDPDSDPETDATPFQNNFDQPDAVASLPTPSDILVSYSTFPGFVSWRDIKSGSWYIETLDRMLDMWADDEDLLSILLMVSNAVSAKGTYKQIPGCFNFLRKRFFFKTK